MTVQLDWPPEVVDRLTDEARKKGSHWTPIFCKRFSSRRARTALLLTTLRSADGPKPARASLKFRSASNPIPKAGLPATTLTMGAPLMAALVIDASIASAWCFPDEQTDYT